jgi:hypothetical protein
MMINNELERMWKEVNVAFFTVFSGPYLEGLRKTINKTSVYIVDVRAETPRYKSEA